MKKFIFFFAVLFGMISTAALAQSKKDSLSFLKKDTSFSVRFKNKLMKENNTASYTNRTVYFLLISEPFDMSVGNVYHYQQCIQNSLNAERLKIYTAYYPFHIYFK